MLKMVDYCVFLGSFCIFWVVGFNFSIRNGLNYCRERVVVRVLVMVDMLMIVLVIGVGGCMGRIVFEKLKKVLG